MKTILFLTLLGLVGLASCDKGFDAETIGKIVQMALDNGEKLGVEETANQARETGPLPRFSCPILNVAAPTSVHALAPQHVKVIGAVGDSLTAANGAKASSILGLLSEDRGASWSMGGESASVSVQTTFPTILRQFSPNLVGYSTGTGGVNSSVSGLNCAYPGDTSFETLQQSKLLFQKMRSNPAINMANDWKVINFFIGGNDLCKSCKDPKYAAPNYVANIRDTLDYMHENFPRTLVNLVLTLDVAGVRLLTGQTCMNMQKTFCDCAHSPSYDATLRKLTQDYQDGVKALIGTGRYDTRSDFTVVLHRFMEFMTPPLTGSGEGDKTYFAPDCFHFSVKGHNEAGKELWNAMLTPPDDKTTEWALGSAIKCPTQLFPYIPTYKNTRSSLKNLLVKN